jgi:WhiB family redox-sensing transcriptional regulator
VSAEPWRAEAACIDRPDVNFFPLRGEDAQPAKAVCAECPVQRECLEYAVKMGTAALGIWGGTSERARRRMRSERHRAAAA